MLKQYIKDEQAKITNMIADKIELPNMSAVKERELITKMYDTFEEVIGEVVNAL